MADLSFSSLQTQLIAQRGLEVLEARRGVTDLFSNKVADDVNAATVLVPYSSNFTASAAGFGQVGAGTLTGKTITFGEPIVSSTPITPNQLTSYGFDDLLNNILPAQLEAVMTVVDQRIGELVNATNFPVQITSSVAVVGHIDSGSATIRTSGSFASQFALVSDKFDGQLKSALAAANTYVQAEILKGNYVNEYKCNNASVIPMSNLATYTTGADGVQLVRDSIVWASKPADVRPNSVSIPYKGLMLAVYLDEDPTTHKTWVQTALTFNAAAGRVGFGARLKVN